MKQVRVYETLNEMFTNGFNLTNVQAVINTETQSKPTLPEAFGEVIDILADRYYDFYIGYVDKWFCPGVAIHLSEEDYERIETRFIRNFTNIYNFTKNKYSELLNYYGAAKNHLLDKVENITATDGEHRVNDTPQNGGSWQDDAHTSLYESTSSTATNTNDLTTLMNRLNEIQDNYMNVLKAWCNEFNGLFIFPVDEFELEEDSDE